MKNKVSSLWAFKQIKCVGKVSVPLCKRILMPDRKRKMKKILDGHLACPAGSSTALASLGWCMFISHSRHNDRQFSGPATYSGVGMPSKAQLILGLKIGQKYANSEFTVLSFVRQRHIFRIVIHCTSNRLNFFSLEIKCNMF